MSLYPKLSDYHHLSSDEELFEENHYSDADLDSSSSSNRRHRYSNHGGQLEDREFRDKTSTVSLSDFERDYHHSPNQHDEKMRHVHQERSQENLGSRCLQGLTGCIRWLERSSKLKTAAVGCILGLLFAVVYRGGGHLLERTTRDNLLTCPSASENNPCLTSSQLQPALLLAHTITDFIHTRSGQYHCKTGDVESDNVTLSELQTLLPEFNIGSSVTKDALYLILFNPHWGVRWLDWKNEEVSPSADLIPGYSDRLISLSPSMSVKCRLSIVVSAIWARIRIIMMVALGVLVCMAVISWYLHKKDREMRGLYIMVDRITEVMKRHNENTRTKKILPYLAITHVRDMLIPPSERKRKHKLWERACSWIAEHESRMRVENQRIAGEDFLVWRWIQMDSLKTDNPSLTATKPGAAPLSDLNESHVSSRQGNWYRGTAFEEYPPGLDSKVAPPTGVPSPCIRLKNMFEAVRHMDDEQATELKNSVLDRCVPHGDVYHVYVDRKSPFGCVYLKMNSVKAAMGAYKALHGGWYKGKLVTAKYIPEPKYHKWFSKSLTSKTPLHPT